MTARRRAVSAVGAVAGAAALAGCSGNPNALDPRGQGAQEIANLWWLMFSLAAAVSVLVIGLLVAVYVRGRRRGDDVPDADEAGGRRWILYGGVVLPVVVLLPVSFVTVRTGARLATPPSADAPVQIELVGHQFWWEVRYPDHGAVTANEIHIPTDTPVELLLRSDDVIHSFRVPNLHGTLDLNPHETNQLFLDADEAGTYRGFCGEFCGIQHAGMQVLVIAQEPEEFEAWVARTAAPRREPDDELVAAGEELFAETGCAGCHTVRGTAYDGVAGPDLTHVASRRTLGAGIVENTRGNLGGWIANSQHIKPGNLMPPSLVDGAELQALVAYLESLE